MRNMMLKFVLAIAVAAIVACENKEQTTTEVEEQTEVTETVAQPVYPSTEEVQQIAPDGVTSDSSSTETMQSIKQNLDKAVQGVDEIKATLKEVKAEQAAQKTETEQSAKTTQTENQGE